MRISIERAENGYIINLAGDRDGMAGRYFVADDIDKVGELVVSQLAAAEMDRNCEPARQSLPPAPTKPFPTLNEQWNQRSGEKPKFGGTVGFDEISKGY